MRMPDFSSLKINASRPLASSTHRLFSLTSLEWNFQQTQTLMLLPGSPRLRTICHRTINKTIADGGICTSYGRDHIEGYHDSTPWIWLRNHVAIQTCTYPIHLPTHNEFLARVSLSSLQGYDIRVWPQTNFAPTL